MSDKPPIPPAIWERVVAFIREGKTGEIVLNIGQGGVSSMKITEVIRAKDVGPVDARDLIRDGLLR